MKSVESRIAELSAIIMESLKDTSVESAIIWAKAVKERSELMDSLSKLKKP